MSKISKLYLLLLLLSSISSIQALLNQNAREAIEMKVGSIVEFDKNRNYFKFTFEGSDKAKIIFDFYEYDEDLFLTKPNGDRVNIKVEDEYHHYSRDYVGNLTENGTYHVEVFCFSYTCEIGSSFSSIIIGDTIDTIDLSKKIYYSQTSYYSGNYYLGTMDYKVTGISEDKYVYLTLTSNDPYYIPYDPVNPYPYVPPIDPYTQPSILITPFEVINIKNPDKNERNVTLYKFEKDNEYIIKIHCLIYYYEYNNDYKNYYYRKFLFFPITLQNFQQIKGDENSLLIDGPTLYLINPNREKRFFLFPGLFMEETIILMAKSNETIEYSIEGLKKIANLPLRSGNMPETRVIEIEKNDPQTTVIFTMPTDLESTMKMFLADEFDYECRNSYFVPANTNKIIYCYEREDKKYYYFNNITTYNSKNKNMHIIFSEENEGTDYIINNYMRLPIFVEKSNQDQSIFLKKYPPKFTYFGVENPYLFKTFYSYGEKYAKYGGINANNYMKVSPMHFRMNSKYLPWFEFYNLYLNQFDIKVNVYIKQIYGGSELYECNADDVNEKDLAFLTTPISNAKCKNKKSIFNRLFTFDGTKIISGYITPDSYFDGYAEINNDDKTIDISAITRDLLKSPNTARYLKKNVEYTVKFTLNHMIKLEPGFDAEITITNGQTSSKINTQNPAVPISGNGFTIKSNNDAMVYFFGKFTNELVQKEINLEQSKGKIVKVSNVDDEILLDIGFEGYYPSTIPIDFRRRENGVHYFDNIYDKLKGKLVKDEKVYIYSYGGTNKNLKIDYVSKNLANANNDFNIFLIPGNNEENTLIINTYQLRNTIQNLHFCHKDTIVKLSFLGDSNSEMSATFTNENYTKFKGIDLFKGDNKMTFSSNLPLVYSYSYWDNIDEDLIEDIWEFWDERVVLYDLDIIEAGKYDKDNIIKIKFKPNYQQSTTRYIIIIAQKNSQNTLERFKDPCYITALLNQRPTDVKVDTIYDIGDKDSVDAEVDISSIKSNDNKYLVNIISQELRFEKKVNFYQPLEFSQEADTHNGGNGSGGNGQGQGQGNEGSQGDGEKEGSETNLALAVTLPIMAVLVIVIVVMFICFRKRGPSSDDLERKANQLV